MHPLWGPIKKAERAKEHLQTLTDEIEAFIKRDRYGATVGKRNPKTGKYPLRAVTTSEDIPPLRWSILIGEVAFNLRSALDQVACQLALTNPRPKSAIPEVLETTSFPIFLYPESRRGVPGRQQWRNNRQAIAHLTASQRALLEGFQPYKRRKRRVSGPGEKSWPFYFSAASGRRHPLWILHELNNADKHRLLQITARAVTGMSLIVRSAPRGFRPRGIYPRKGGQLVNGAYIGAVDIDGNWEGVDLYVGVHPQIVFWSGCDAVKSLPVLPTLEAIHHEVYYRVLVPLAKEFPPLEPPYGPPE